MGNRVFCIMKRVLLFCLFLFSSSLSAENATELILTKFDRKLGIYLLNSGFEPVLVNRRFALGSGTREIELIFTNSDGKVFPFSVKINTGGVKKSDFTELAPGSRIGREFDLGRLSEDYLLENGSYIVKAIYENKIQVFSETAFMKKLESNVISIEIGSDKNILQKPATSSLHAAKPGKSLPEQ